MIVDEIRSQENCVNLTNNSVKDQLDGTVVYERVNGEEKADFELEDEHSNVGICVFWEKKGPSSDIAECQS
nr:hypothetical transcript [Hymenolepis microstoma]